jgi:hypothetical protein
MELSFFIAGTPLSFETPDEHAELTAVRFCGDDFVAGALREACEVLLCRGIVREHLKDLTDLECVDALPRLEERLRAVEPDAIKRLCWNRLLWHDFSFWTG